MTYPPPTLAIDKTNDTPQDTDHPDHHNAMAGAINDVVGRLNTLITQVGDLSTSRRNLIDNGAMQVAQRATSVASITTGGYATADRWFSAITTLGTWTNSVEVDGPSATPFKKSWKWLCTTADASPAAADQFSVRQSIEGQFLQQLLKGSASAVGLTLSFWVKGTTTGTYIVELEDADNTRRICAAYTISAANTWEFKTITFPGDVTGALDNDANASLTLIFWLAAGSNFTSGSLGTSWGANANTTRAVGQTNLAGATNRAWFITGVQLEAGSVASSYEHRPIDVEERRCHRYCRRIGGEAYNAIGQGHQDNSTTQAKIWVKLSTMLRAFPTVTSSTLELVTDVGATQAVTGVAASQNQSRMDEIMCQITTAAFGTSAEPCHLRAANNVAGFMLLSADL